MFPVSLDCSFPMVAPFIMVVVFLEHSFFEVKLLNGCAENNKTGNIYAKIKLDFLGLS
jgi:hypothetical protein